MRRRRLAVAGRLLAAGLGASALGGCAPRPALEVHPAAAAPGEPLEVAVAHPGGEGSSVSVELLDQARVSLAAASLALEDGRARAWLYPREPSVPGDLLLIAAGHDRRGRRLGRRTARVVLDTDRPVVLPSLLAGFHDPEPSSEGEYRWTTGSAAAELESLPGDALLHLRLRCAGEAGRSLRLLAGGRLLLARACGSPQAQWLRLPVPGSLWRGEPFVTLDLVVDPPFRPADMAASDDRRELGLQLFSLLATLDPGPRSRVPEPRSFLPGPRR